MKEEGWEVSHCDGMTSSLKVGALEVFYAKEQGSNTPDGAFLALSLSTKTQAILQFVFSSNRSKQWNLHFKSPWTDLF